MRIIIASTIVPFVSGGGTMIVDWLEEKLREYGHEVDTVKIPFSSDYRYMLEQMLALRFYHLEDLCDRLIAIRMPIYLMKHPDKYLWFIHHYRFIYDLWNTPLENIPKTPEGYAIRENIMRADDLAFKEAKKIYTNSKVVSARLKKFNDIDAEVVYPPLLHPEQFYCKEYGDYIYYPSRICDPKRQLLAVQAMQYTKSNVKLLITGRSESEECLQKILRVIEEHNLQDKVIIENRWITEQEKTDYFASCLAGLYIPFDEDSYGYPSLEAHESHKLVISCKDSGGTDELIVPEYNGFLLDPNPEVLARTFDDLYLHRDKAQKMGDSAKEQLNKLKINWDNVIRRFTE